MNNGNQSEKGTYGALFHFFNDPELQDCSLFGIVNRIFRNPCCKRVLKHFRFFEWCILHLILVHDSC